MNNMALTCVSPLNQCINSPNISIKHGFTSKQHSSNPNFINHVSPLNSRRIHASIENVAANSKDDDDKSEKRKQGLPADLEEDLMPKHIAVIMDGNRRWAVQRGWSPMAGHSAGRMALKPLLRRCFEFKIKAEEVDFLMGLFEDSFRTDMEELICLGCRVTVMGNKAMFSKTLQKLSMDVEEKSRANSGTHINFAINYSGKYDITQACRNIATKVKESFIVPDEVNESVFEQELDTKLIDFPCPDLLIRTSGEIRLSNFMLWQLAYSELFFVKKLFPDFDENDLVEALLAFQKIRKNSSLDP